MGFAGRFFSTNSRTPATRSGETVPSTTLSLKSWWASCWAVRSWAAMGKGRGFLDGGQLAGGSLVEAGPFLLGKFLGQHALGGGDDQAGDLGAGLGQHLFLLQLDGFAGLGDHFRAL